MKSLAITLTMIVTTGVVYGGGNDKLSNNPYYISLISTCTPRTENNDHDITSSHPNYDPTYINFRRQTPTFTRHNDKSFINHTNVKYAIQAIMLTNARQFLKNQHSSNLAYTNYSGIQTVNKLLNQAKNDLLSKTQTMGPAKLFYNTSNSVQNQRCFSVQTYYANPEDKIAFPVISITECNSTGWELHQLSRKAPRPYCLPLSYLSQTQNPFAWDQKKISIFVSEAEQSTQTLT